MTGCGIEKLETLGWWNGWRRDATRDLMTQKGLIGPGAELLRGGKAAVGRLVSAAFCGSALASEFGLRGEWQE